METKRLVYLVAVVFAVFMMFQYLEFPYGDVISSLFSATKIHITNTRSYPHENSSLLLQISGDMNMTGASDVLVKGIMNTYKGHDDDMIDIIKHNRSETKKELDDSIDLNRNATSLSVHLANVSSVIEVPRKKQKRKVVVISEMHDILVHNRESSHSMVYMMNSKLGMLILVVLTQF